MKTLYIFNRDLRIVDNRALWEACSRSSKVVAIYVVDREDLERRRINAKDPRLSLLIEALSEISKVTKLRIFSGNIREVVEYLLDRYRFEALYMSYPHSWRDREKSIEIRDICTKLGVKYAEVFDNTLVDYREIGNVNNFTSFYKIWLKHIDAQIISSPDTNKFIEIDEPDLEEFMQKNNWRLEKTMWSLRELYSRLEHFDFKKYDLLKDYPGIDGTSKLSPYISHGIVSVRNIYMKTRGLSNEFLRQLAWREYYYYLGFKYPWMKKFELKPNMRDIEWKNNSEHLKRYIEGKTGYPIIDAGVNQLKRENWVHNRVRLIISNFLVKDLHIDWRIGEKVFSEYLIDYDEVLNIGNWQWSASVGVDPLPIRVFNPIIQAKKYDPDCRYIKKYIPELRDYSCKELHDPLKNKIKGYYEPIVEHYSAIEEFKRMIFDR